MAMDPDPMPTRAGAVRAILAGGIAGAVLELVPAFIVYHGLGVPPGRLMQWIASGLLGRAAYAGGSGTALLGGVLHLLISLVAAGLYVLAARRWPRLARQPLRWGLAYGVAVYLFMNFLVVPLSAAGFGPNTRIDLLAMSIATHLFLFGVPIALAARLFLVPRGARGLSAPSAWTR